MQLAIIRDGLRHRRVRAFARTVEILREGPRAAPHREAGLIALRVAYSCPECHAERAVILSNPGRGGRFHESRDAARDERPKAAEFENARQRYARLKRTGFVLDVFDVRHANGMIRRGFSLGRVAAVKDTDIATLQRDRAMLELVDMIARFRYIRL